MIIHRSTNEINSQQWIDLTVRSSTASFFQTRDCYDFYATLSFLKPFVYGISENDELVGLICGYVIADGSTAKKFFSRRAIVPGGVLIDEKISSDALRLLLQTAISELKQTAIYFEVRNYNDYSSFRKDFETVGFKYQPHLNFHVSTPDEETALKNLSTTKRRDIKLSRKEGTEWYATTDLHEVKAYYDILHQLYQTKIKTPLFPYEFFEKLSQLSVARIFVVKHNSKIIGGSVCVLLPGKAIYEWFVCGLDGQIKNVFPSTLATWAAIEYASRQGFSIFDMMGAGKPDEGYGVREFKARFGGELVEHGRFLFIQKPLLYQLGKKVIQLKSAKHFTPQKTPVKVSQFYVIADLEKIDRQEWTAFVLEHPNGNIFQTPEMFDLYNRTPNYTPYIFIAYNNKKEIVGCLMSVTHREYSGLLGSLTLRSIVMGGPITKENNADVASILLARYNNIVAPTVIYSQFRNLFDTRLFSYVFEKNNFNFVEHLDVLIDLNQSKEQLTKNLHKERKRNINKAENEGLKFKEITSDTEIKELISVLKQTYKRVKTPMASELLFLDAKKILGDKVSFFGAYYNDKLIAGQIRLNFKDSVYAWFSGSNEKHFTKRPNDFLMWKVLLWYKDKNYSVFDFGGAGKPNIPYGVRDYKLKYGGQLVNFGRFECTHKRVLMLCGKVAYKLYRLCK